MLDVEIAREIGRWIIGHWFIVLALFGVLVWAVWYYLEERGENYDAQGVLLVSLFITVVIGASLLVLYWLVRFVRWSWYR